MSQSAGSQVHTVMNEARLFPPTAEFSAQARIPSLRRTSNSGSEAAADPEAFWGELAAELHWFKPFTKVLDWNEPYAQWFVGGKTNASYNCLDVHLGTPRKNKAAIIWEGEPGDNRTLTYQQLHREVCKFANVLKSLGIEPRRRRLDLHADGAGAGHRHAGLRRIGAVHSVIFGGFSSEAIADRNNDAKAKLQITADGGWRRGQQLPLKDNVDEALAKSPTVQEVHRAAAARAIDVHMQAGRDLWWHDLMREASADCPAEPLDSETPLFILYTSGSTGKPKGIKHTTAGYNLFAKKTIRVGLRPTATKTSSGVRPTAAGSPGTATSSTARCRPAPPW